MDVTEIVPGDVALLRTGDLVPADLRLLDACELECDEAVLTGEAMPHSASAKLRLPAFDLSDALTSLA